MCLRLRDARVDFDREGDRELTELCDDEVNFAFELYLGRGGLRDGMLQSVAVETFEVVKACIKLAQGVCPPAACEQIKEDVCSSRWY